MRCAKTKRLITPYIDAELDRETRQAFESHLAGCAGCRRDLEEVRKLSGLFAQSVRHNAPLGFSTRVMANVKTGKAASGFGIPFFAKLAEAAVILLLAVVGMISGGFLVNNHGPQGTAVSSSFSLEVFEPAPPDSIGSAYLAMTEVKNEK